MCVNGGDTYSSGSLVLQLPKVEWSAQYFGPVSWMLIICPTEGCLAYCLLLVSWFKCIQKWHSMPAIWSPGGRRCLR